MKWLLLRELQLAWRRRADSLMSLSFYILVLTLFPLGLGAEGAGSTQQAVSGALWVSMLLAVMLAIPGLYRQDIEDGTLEQWRSMEMPLELVVSAKLMAMTIFVALPLLCVAPLMALMLGGTTVAAADSRQLLQLVLTLGLGVIALLSLGSAGAALVATTSQRRGSFLCMILMLPLAVPVLIFGSAASLGVNSVSSEAFLFLLAITCAVLPLGIGLSALILRHLES